MAAQGPVTLSFPFDLTMRDTAIGDVVQPAGEGAALIESMNTRLGNGGGVPDKSPLSAEIATMTAARYVGGMVASGNGSTLVFTKDGNARVTTGGVEFPLVSPFVAHQQNSYYPYEVASSGVIPGSIAYSSPAVCEDADGNVWFCSVRASDSGYSSVFVTAQSPTGELVLAPTKVADIAVQPYTQPWFGLTKTTGGFVNVWWVDTGVIMLRRVTVNAATMTMAFGSPAMSVYTPTGTSPGNIYVHVDPNSTVTRYAFLVCLDSAVANSITAMRIDTTDGSIFATSTQALGAGLDYICLRHVEDNGTQRVFVAASRSAGACWYYSFDGSSMTLSWRTAGAAANGQVACSFYAYGASKYAVFAASHPFGSFPAQASGTTFSFLNATSGATTGTPYYLPWKALVSNGAYDIDSSTSIFPVFALQNVYSQSSSRDPASINFVSDPSIEVYRVNPYSASLVGRFAVDTACIYPIGNGTVIASSGNLELCEGGVMLAYLEDTTINNGVFSPGCISRYVRLATAPSQPRFATDGYGLAQIAAGPAQWDGTEVVEWSPTAIPKVYSEANTGGGAGVSAGTYLLSAVVYWKDSTGQVHRSFPALQNTLTTTGGDKPTIYVSRPATMKDGVNQESVQVFVYSSLDAGSVMYAQQWQPTSTSSTVWAFASITTPVTGAVNPPIYSDGAAGSVIGAQCPPTFADVVPVKTRQFGINAERPSEIWFSKERESGIAWEFSSELTIALPASSGGAVALAESGGVLVALCKNGVWAISGTGPDATNTTGEFNAPEQISDIGCTSKRSVVRTPAGVLYISGTRFASVEGGYTDDIDASQVGTGLPVVMRSGRDVVWLSSEGEHRCFNYALNRWTAWDETTVPAVDCAAYDQKTGKIFCYSSSDLKIRTLDPDERSTAAQISLTTGHVLLGGPQDDCAIHDIIVHCAYVGAHDFNATVWSDYGAGTTYTIDAATLAGAVVNGYYDVLISPPSPSMRAIKIKVYETSASGVAMQPINCTIQFAKSVGVRRGAITAHARL